jgi:transcriptional regulator with XRE-family HTH domain
MNIQWIVDELRIKGISQRELSKQLNLDIAAMSRTLNGKRSLQIHELVTIARILNIDFNRVIAKLGLITLEEVDVENENLKCRIDQFEYEAAFDKSEISKLKAEVARLKSVVKNLAVSL